MSYLVAEEKLEPIHTGIQHGTMQAHISLTAKNGQPRYKFDCFQLVKTSTRSSVKKRYLYDHDDDIHDVAKCLEKGDQWIVPAKGQESPPEPSAEAPALATDDEVGLSVGEVATILHLLVSVRELDKASDALREFEETVRAALREFSSEEITRAVAKYKGSARYQAIERLRKKFTPDLSPPQSPSTTAPICTR